MDTLPEDIIHHIQTFAPDHRPKMSPVLKEILAWKNSMLKNRFTRELVKLDRQPYFSVISFNPFFAKIQHVDKTYTVRIGPHYPMEEPRFFLQGRRLQPFDWWSPAYSLEAAIRTYHVDLTSNQPVFYQDCEPDARLKACVKC